MIHLDWFDRNLQLFILDLKKQIRSTVDVIENPDPILVEKISNRDDHLDNLKGMIENRCFKELAGNILEEKQYVYFIRGVHNIAQGLEKIGDYLVSIANQTLYFADKNYFKENYDYKLIFEILEKSLDKIHLALFTQSLDMAITICRSEVLMDYIYETKLKKIISKLQSHQSHTSNLVTSIFIFHYLERVGDALLNIGEAIISSILVDNLKIDQVNSLKDSLGFDNHNELALNGVKFQSIWGTRSGCRIGEVFDEERQIESIYKDGDSRKLLKEKDNILNWNKNFPGIAPKVINFEDNGQHSTILLERLFGKTIKETLINGDTELLPIMIDAFEKNLYSIWSQTHSHEKLQSNFMKQLVKRLPEIYFIHSDLLNTSTQFGKIQNSSLDDSIEELIEIEKELHVPFSILGHGDFNIDNIIYNPETKKIHYIDLHRSDRADYAQDISVCLISCFRLPIFNSEVRNLINQTIARIYEFAFNYSVEHNDKSFRYRLGLGLVRSLTTSTRFELNKNFSKEMILRSNYLIQSLLKNKNTINQFDFPINILFYER